VDFSSTGSGPVEFLSTGWAVDLKDGVGRGGFSKTGWHAVGCPNAGGVRWVLIDGVGHTGLLRSVVCEKPR
jgi:hypothetical protein